MAGMPRPPLARQLLATLLLSLFAAACGRTAGSPVDPAQLGYQACNSYYGCGPGRHCSAAGTCWAECRDSADCGLTDPGGRRWLCNPFGQCVAPGGERACSAHADCGPDGLCNGRCSRSGAVCGAAAECPYTDEACQGRCAAWCRNDDDCAGGDAALDCTPLGRCLLPGWERWVAPGRLPPTACARDAQCKALGWGWACRSGRCAPTDAGPDLGSGPADQPAHRLRGIWGLRLNLALITYGLPLLSRQTTNSAHLFLVRARHTGDDLLELDEKLCALEMINFSDGDRPPSDLIHVTIPHTFLAALPLAHHRVQLPSAAAGTPFVSDRWLELRGALLDDPAQDPLPTRHDYEARPDDPRLWDQDADGRPGMTTLTDGVLRGEIYIVQRIAFALDGVLVDADHIEGRVRAETEEHLLDASKASLVYDIETALHPDADRTTFRMLRLADDASCADLLAEAERTGSWLAYRESL